MIAILLTPSAGKPNTLPTMTEDSAAFREWVATYYSRINQLAVEDAA